MGLPTLEQFFRRQIEQGFHRCGLAEPHLLDYVSDLLTRFSRTSAVFSLGDKSLDTVAEHLLEFRDAEESSPRPDRARQASVMRHLGEYTLFMSGLFRERVRSRGQLGYYVDHGRSAYGTSAEFEPNPGRARVFWRLYREFEQVSDALDLLRHRQLPMAGGRREDVVFAMWRR